MSPYEIGGEEFLAEEERADRGRGHGHGRGHHPKRRAKGGVALRVRIRPLPSTPRRVLRKVLYLPVVLGDEWLLSQASGITDFTTVGGGEFSHPQPGDHAKMLRDLGIDTCTMTWDPSWMTYRHQGPGDVKKALYRILESERPVHLTAVLGGTRRKHLGPEYDAAVTLRSIDRRLVHGEPDTRYFDLDFREDRKLNVNRRRHGGHGHGRHRFPLMHKLKPHESLRDLARHYYHHGDAWRHIAKANGIKKWGSQDPIVRTRRFKVGDRIKIPKKPDRARGPGDGGTSPRNPERGLYLTEDE